MASFANARTRRAVAADGALGAEHTATERSSRYDFCPRAAELVSQLRNQRRMVCGRHLLIDLLSLFQGPLPRRPRAGPEFPYLLRGALLPMRQMPQQVLSGPLPRHPDHLHLLLADRSKTQEPFVEHSASP